MKSVAVIGGGPTGLSCAYELAKGGVDVKLYERESLLGGRIRDLIIENTSYPLGARTLHDEMLDLIGELGLSARLHKAEANSKPGIFFRGRLISLGTWSVLFNTTLSLRTKYDLARFRRFLTRLTPETASQIPKVTLKEFIIHHYSYGLYDEFIQPYAIAELGGNADSVAAPRGLRRISSAFESGFELDGGLSTLVGVIEGRLSGKVIHCGVNKIVASSDSTFIVSTAADSRQFEAVVCCIPTPEIKKIIDGVLLPNVAYNSRQVYVVKGKSRHPRVSAILVGDSKLNINYLVRWGAGAVVASSGGEINLSPFFDSFEVIHTHKWEYDNARLSSDDKNGAPATNIPNFYVGGDYIYGGGVGASFRAGKDIAKLILAGPRSSKNELPKAM